MLQPSRRQTGHNPQTATGLLWGCSQREALKKCGVAPDVREHQQRPRERHHNANAKRPATLETLSNVITDATTPGNANGVIGRHTAPRRQRTGRPPPCCGQFALYQTTKAKTNHTARGAVSRSASYPNSASPMAPSSTKQGSKPSPAHLETPAFRCAPPSPIIGAAPTACGCWYCPPRPPSRRRSEEQGPARPQRGGA